MARTQLWLSGGGPRLSVLDVDGTLVDETGELFEGAVDLVHELSRRGDVALCSARPLVSLIELAAGLEPIGWLCASQGGLVARRVVREPRIPAGWRVYRSSPLKAQQVMGLAARARRLGYECFYHGRNHWFVDRETVASRTEASICRVGPVVRRPLVGEGVYKVAVVASGDQAIDPSPFEMDGIRVVTSKSNYLEITAAGASSAKGADHIAAMSEVAPANILALGDAVNDLDMLSLAGLALTFVGAPEILRNKAAWILPNPSTGGLKMLLLELAEASP